MSENADGFVECAECAAKPGAPTLCASCLANRTAINQLSERVRMLEGQKRDLEDRVRAMKRAVEGVD